MDILPPNNPEEYYDASIFPIIEKQNNPYKNEEPAPVSIELGKSSYDDYYGFAISAVLSAIIGYFIFANQQMTNFYSGFYAGFYEGDHVVSTKGRVMQVLIVVLLHFCSSYWLL